MTEVSRHSIALPAGWVRLPGRVAPEQAARASIEEALVAGAAPGSWSTEVGSALAAHNGHFLEIAGVPAVRWWDTDPAPETIPAGARVLGARTVLGRIPGRDDLLLTARLTVATETALPARDDDVRGERMVVEALGVLFDAMCASIQWRGADGGHVVVEPDGTMVR